MANVFFIGATGHIGSAVIESLYSQLPGCTITALVRSEEKGALLKETFPNIKTVVGDLDSADLIEKSAKDASIVINTAPDPTHTAAVDAVKRGLSTRPEKGFYIHTSGAASIWNTPDGSKSTGKIWSDVEHIKDIINLPTASLHVTEDNFVRALGDTMNVAIISPTLVYGLSPSKVHPTPITIPDLIRSMKVVNGGFTISAGKNILGFVHVKDLAQIYVSLAVDAAKGASGSNKELWGQEAYYYAQSEETEFDAFMRALVPVIKQHGAITSDHIQPINVGKALESIGERPDMDLKAWNEHIAMMYGTDMRCRSDRAAKLLNWTPKGPKLTDTLAEVTDVFFKRGIATH
ncbi:hypothetical protein HGRIS_007382 [Hohenbuehelia grisea]|uniref:NAD(P)-binding domain-containing protein n=1 Tax=Hohenbuehelia grisea TaxID=104357 RepID=A0ABR3J625_9AGAR